MSSCRALIFLSCVVVSFFWICRGDVLVQLNVNRPFNDVNEKFVSYAIKPEDLYKALDGPNRISLTRMAGLLGDSYVKFVGDYNFAENSETKIRSPTRVIWKGFNRWTRAVNWTMVIPVPYSPNTWDPMYTLKVLNNSYLIGVNDCIWQLGTDFGSSRAQDYVTELQTLHLMVESFKPLVNDWRIMGADISAGSSPDETNRYIELSQDLNSAFGWTQPVDAVSSNSLNSYIYENDPALKMLLSKKVPVWLSIPANPKSKKTKQNIGRFHAEEVIDGLRWAQTLGDAASSGFNVVFRRISSSDLERPNFSFFVAALFKKVMGSRVFPARPLNIFALHNKLYTHCANAVSGGIAFMVVNKDEKPMHMSVRSLTNLKSTEVWQYTLTAKKGIVLLNNEKLNVNSTLKPQVRAKKPETPVQLSTPGYSVSFWVLPTVNLEHCQYTEVDVEEVENGSDDEKVVEKRYSSADRLLRQLIKESSVPSGGLAKAFIRKRRYATLADRPKRFILADNNVKSDATLPLSLHAEKSMQKRESAIVPLPSPVSNQNAALQWFINLLEQPKHFAQPSLLKRNARSAEDIFGPIFGTSESKKSTVTRKITEIKKPEKKIKPIFDLEHFDEEEFFKKINEHTEPELPRLPEGDVHLKLILNADGEEIDDYPEEKKKIVKKSHKSGDYSKEAVSEMKPIRLLPTEFYEALPLGGFKPAANKMNLGNALNSLLFPEPFSKKVSKVNQKKPMEKVKEMPVQPEPLQDIEEIPPRKYEKDGKFAKDFIRAQEELSKSYQKDDQKDEQEDEELTEDQVVTHKTKKTVSSEEEDFETVKKTDPLDVDERREAQKRKFIEFLTENIENYFVDKEEPEKKTKNKSQKKAKSGSNNNKNDNYSKDSDETPWWDLSSMSKKRAPRALKNFEIPDDLWRSNMITKDDIIEPLGSSIITDPMAKYEYELINENKPITNSIDDENNMDETSKSLMSTVKQKVTKLVDILTKHIHKMLNTLTKHVETNQSIESSTMTNTLEKEMVNNYTNDEKTN